jgi:ABC-type sugar transport system ATPase subunit
MLNQLSQKGMGMIMVSSNLQEIISLADRVLVVRQGHIAGELDHNNVSLAEILSLASKGGTQ